MEKAKITDTKPEMVNLTKGKVYAWCTCGLSEHGSMCDGKHTAGGFKPQIFKAEKTETRAICMCKQTKNPPYCDGSHNKL